MRTPIEINHRAIKDAIEKLSSDLQVYKNVLDYTEVITGKRELMSIHQIDSIILKDSGYSNIQLVAELRGISNEYNYILKNLSNFNPDNYTDTLEIKESVVEAIEMANTTYLSEDAEQVNRKLLKVVDILNTLNRNYAKTLVADYNGVWTINLLQLQMLSDEIAR